MTTLTMYDPQQGCEVEVYPPCNCGAVLNQYEIETFGTVCESCANHYYEEQQIMANELNEC